VLEKVPAFEDLATGSRIRKVERADSYEAFLMHRIPSGVSKAGPIPIEVKRSMRDKALERRIAQQQHLPFVRMRSSTGNGFRLVIERIAASPDQTDDPNGYGLSRSTQIVALPVV
jgi:hypothetical protein